MGPTFHNIGEDPKSAMVVLAAVGMQMPECGRAATTSVRVRQQRLDGNRLTLFWEEVISEDRDIRCDF